MTQMGGAVRLKWVGQLFQIEFMFLGDMLEKHWSSGEYPFGFGPFELPPRGLLHRKGETTPYLIRLALRSPVLGWHSQCL